MAPLVRFAASERDDAAGYPRAIARGSQSRGSASPNSRRESGRRRHSHHRFETLTMLAVLFVSIFLPSTGFALTESEIPEHLRPWKQWVLDGIGDAACPNVSGARICQWPGSLELHLNQDGGAFALHVLTEIPAFVTLPGDRRAWPQNVSIGTKRVAVVERDAKPVVFLGAGSYDIRGQFSWKRFPETLGIGQDTAFIRLSVDGEEIPLLKRDGGDLWLKGLQNNENAPEDSPNAELQVYRKLTDGVPILVQTRLVWQVAGRPREVELASPLVAGTLPLSVSGDLAVSLGPTGKLRIQLAPGKHEVTIDARVVGSPSALHSGARPEPWPAQEIWVWKPDGVLRVVEIGGLSSVDPSRTDLPEEWKRLSAYAVPPNGVMTLRTTRRGESQLPRNQIALRRQFWLDEKAEQFTVRDHLSGALHQRWRLDKLGGTLGQVTVGGIDQVITRTPKGLDGIAGVEVRDGSLDLTAVSRVPREAQLAAVGWDEDVDSLSAELHLPPGWDIFAATGVDEVRGTWLSRWNLFSVFYVLLIALATGRLLGVPASVIAGAALVLSHGEQNAPSYIWAALLVLCALLLVLKTDRWRWWFRLGFRVTGLVFLVMLVPFSVQQVRFALYPHLDTDFDADSSKFEETAQALGAPAPNEDLNEAPGEVQAEAQTALNAEVQRAELAVGEAGEQANRQTGSAPDFVQDDQGDQIRTKAGKRRGAWSPSRTSMASSSYRQEQKQFKADAVVQTGPGIPDVSARSWHLNWTGPVERHHSMRLYFISPTGMRVLTALRLAAIIALAWLLWRKVGRTPPGTSASRRSQSEGSQSEGSQSEGSQSEGSQPEDSHPRGSLRDSARSVAALRRRAGSLALLALVGGALLAPRAARASEPSSAMLEQLKQRLTKAPACEPDCVSVSEARLSLDQQLHFVATVHAGATVGYRLPGPASALALVRVKIDGKPATELRLETSGAYSLRLPEGVHEVELTARLRSDRTNLDLGTAPHHIVVAASGWVVTGVTDDGHAESNTLTLLRVVAPVDSPRDAGDAEKAGSGSQIAVPPWFTVERHLRLGVTGRVTTTAERISDASTPEVLRIELLAGEQVTTPGIEAEGGYATLSFAREVKTISFDSVLQVPSNADESLKLSLVAPAVDAGRSETWVLECGVIWHCRTEGIVSTQHLEAGRQRQTFHPLAGEKLVISARQPSAAKGQSATVTAASLTWTPGMRLSRSTLSVSMKTSQARVHTLRIPEQAHLDRVSVDGSTQAAESEAGRVRVSLSPGSHTVELSFRESSGLSTLLRTPAVNVGSAGVNFRVAVDLPEQRWLLFAHGPAQGPAILFWGYLLLIVAGAFLLPKPAASPVERKHWLLLGLGLTQIPAALVVFVVGWFFLVAARPGWVKEGGLLANRRHLRNLAQLGLVLASLCFLGVLAGSVYEGLVTSPDMEISGAGSYGSHLAWYVDTSPGSIPEGWVLSVSIWVWRGAMLVWALWLAQALLVWLRWAWSSANDCGFWASKPKLPRRAEPRTASVAFGSAPSPSSPTPPSDARPSSGGEPATPSSADPPKK